MSEDNKGEEISQKGNDWEVVALTESAYAAAPGPRNILDNIDSSLSGNDDSETARALFMSGHFGLSPSVHENLPKESELKEKFSGEGYDHEIDRVMEEQGSKSDLKQDENFNIEGLISDELSGVQSFYSSELGDVASKKSIDKDESLYGIGKSSYDDSSAAGVPLIGEEGMKSDESFESLDDVVNNKFSESDDLPHDAWWRRHASSLYGHAKNANPYWSLVVAATVIGLVIIGRRWQRDRPQVFQLKSQLTIEHKVLHFLIIFFSFHWLLFYSPLGCVYFV